MFLSYFRVPIHIGLYKAYNYTEKHWYSGIVSEYSDRTHKQLQHQEVFYNVVRDVLFFLFLLSRNACCMGVKHISI